MLAWALSVLLVVALAACVIPASRAAARIMKSALVRSVNSVNMTIIERRVSRAASVVSA